MTSRRLIVAMFTATALTAAVGVAYAADSTSHPSSSPSSRPRGWHPGLAGRGQFGRRPSGATAGMPGGLPFAAAGIGGLVGRVEHGQFVLSKPGGGSQTDAIQSGTASAVSTTSITVKSLDGFTQSYVVNSSTRRSGGCSASTLAAGDDVTVIASVQGSTDTALSIMRRVTFTPPAAGSTPRPTPTGTSAPGRAGGCGRGFGFGFGPSAFGGGPSGAPSPPATP